MEVVSNKPKRFGGDVNSSDRTASPGAGDKAIWCGEESSVGRAVSFVSIKRDSMSDMALAVGLLIGFFAQHFSASSQIGFDN
jgi:hypothetical protein